MAQKQLGSDHLPPPFAITTTDLGETIALSVAGELDAVTAPELQAAMLGVNTDCRHLIDLSELTFIDSIGLGILLGAKKLSRERASQLFVIPSAHDGVTRVFALTDATKALIQAPSDGAERESAGPPSLSTAPS
jgi:anti-sigma B factor antagonist